MHISPSSTTTAAAAAAAAVFMSVGGANGFLVPSALTRGAAVAASSGLPPSSLRRLQRRLWPRTWMSDNSINNSSSNKNNSNNNKKKSGGVNSSSSRLLPRATTRRNLIQVAGAAIASASTLSISDLVNPEAASAAAVKYSSTVTDADRRGVEQTTIRWKDTVTLGTPDAPRKTADLYASDGVLWGTVSEEVRDTPAEIYDYFDYFARLPKLRLSEYTPVSVRVYNDFATQAGTYTFAWQGADGETKEKRARFSFTFRRDLESPTEWTIVEHHSSSMPISPAELKHVRNSGMNVF